MCVKIRGNYFIFFNFEKACPFKFVPNMHPNTCCGFNISLAVYRALHWGVQSALNFLLMDKTHQSSYIFLQWWW